MNTVILIGRLTKDPELNYTSNQTAKTTFTLAVDRMRKDDGADFIRIVVWGKQAETCDRYLAKGRQVAVRGRIQTGSYEGKDGKTVYTTDVVAENVEFLGGGERQHEPQDEPQDEPQHEPQENLDSWGVDDDLPY